MELKLLDKIRQIGLGTTIDTVLYTLRKEWINWHYPRQESLLLVKSPKDVLSSLRTPRGAQFCFVDGTQQFEMRLSYLTSDLVRIHWDYGKPSPPYSIEKSNWSEVPLSYEITDTIYFIASSEMKVGILPDGGIRYFDGQGNLLREDLPPEFSASQIKHRALLEPNSHVYGLGQRSASLNLRGGTYQMWNSDPGGAHEAGVDPLYICIPVYLVLHNKGSYLFFYENSFPAKFSFKETAEANFESGQLKYYFFLGPPQMAFQRYAELTGKPDLPPIWALGYHQSRWGYKNEEDVREVIQKFEEHKLKISAIHLDIDYMDGYRIFTIHPFNFSKLPKITEEFREKGVHTVAIINPGIKTDPKYAVYKDGIKRKVFCTLPQGKPFNGVVWSGRSVYPDFTDPKVRVWWGDQYRILHEAGISGYWHDMNEPVSFTAWGRMDLPHSVYHDMEGQGGDHKQGHNVYGFLMDQAGYEGLRHLDPEKRPWILSRSGWAGFQRYAWHWTADTVTSWDNLKQTVRTILGISLSGQPYSGSDIGGFLGNPTPELYTRWFQLATFLPFFRTHSAIFSDPREPWLFGEPTLSIVRTFLNLRYQLLLYWYSLAWQTSKTGLPLIRPFFWCKPENPNYWDIDDTFFLGDDLLVAPILNEGATQINLQLPQGCWYDFWDLTSFTGPGRITYGVKLEEIPILVRGGCILPYLVNDEIELAFYAPSLQEKIQSPVSALHLYLDAGNGYPGTNQEWRLDQFSYSWDGQDITIHSKTQGDYPFPYKKIYFKVIGITPKRVWLEDIEIPYEGNRFVVNSFREIKLRI